MRRALVLAAALLGLASGLRAQQVVARIGGELSVSPYTNLLIPVTVDMTASGGATLGSYTARLTWNPTILTYSGYVSGGTQDTTSQGNFPPPAMNSDSSYAGVLKFSAVSPAGVGGLVTIAQLRFYASYDTLPSPLTLSFSEMSAAGTFASLLPILTVQGATFCLSRGLYGDLDRDGASNSRDALIVLSKVVGLPVDPQVADTLVADVDADGRTTSRDALVILSYAVGMPVTGQRVLLPVPASCGTGSARQVAVEPGNIDLVVGQAFKLLPQATDSAGRTVALPPVTWRSSDYTVAGIDAEGIVMPRAPGTATISAELGPGVSATATVTVLARRPNWYVDIAATGRPVQNGSAALPFEGPHLAFPLVQEGDTVRVATGAYDWPGATAVLTRGLVLVGGTPGDTTTRPVIRAPNNYQAFWLQGGQRFEARNIAFAGFEGVFDVDGVRNLILEDVQFVEGQTSMNAIYSCPNGGMDTLRVDRTQFLGNPQSPYHGDAIYIGGCSTLDVKVLLLRDSRIERMYDAVTGYGVDSLQVVRSVIRDNRGDGIYLSQEYNEYPALHITQSRIERNRYAAVAIYDARRIVIDTSVIGSDSSNLLTLRHDFSTRGHTYLHGDSLFMAAPYYDWINAYATDSLVFEDVVLRFPDDTAVVPYSYVDADVTVLRRTRLLNVGGSYHALNVFGRRLLVDSLSMTACVAVGCSPAYGLAFQGEGVQSFGQVLRSDFTAIDYPIQANNAGTVLEVRDVTADSVYVGVYANNMDSVAVHNSTFTRVKYAGVEVLSLTGARGPSLISGNAVTCVPPAGYSYGVYVHDGATALVESDTVTTCDRGIEFTNARSRSRIRQSTLRSNNIGIAITQYFPYDTVYVPIDSSSVSGAATAAVSVYGVAPFTHNRLENNPGDGLSISYAYGAVVQAHDNAFVNNGGFAIAAPSDTVDASANWWGSPSQPPVGTTPNGVLGRVNTTSPLASAPPNLPGLAPPIGSVFGAPTARSEATLGAPGQHLAGDGRRGAASVEREAVRQQERETRRQAKAARAAANRSRQTTH